IILKHGQFILGPLTFALLFTVMLAPVSDFFEKLVKYKIPAILLTILSVALVLGVIITLFSVQLTSIISELPNITENINEGIAQIMSWVNKNLNLNKSEIQENIPSILDSSMDYIRKGISFSSTFLFNLLFTLLLVFFLLWYKDSFHGFILMQSKKKHREEFKAMLLQINRTLQRYLYGLLGVIAILAVLNSVGLLIIGIDYAVFWGVLAAFLAVIPYIGTTLGGTLPFLYAIATAGNFWQPLAVLGMYVVIQQIEGNIITPNVVGSSVSINPLIALLAILLGGVIWGISGIFLAIPIIAVVKIFLEHKNRTKAIAALMSNKVHKQDEEFWKDMDEDRYRLES
ncbi:MAG: AI-2E family transporter, partial [Bacteroidota bacterium]